MYDLLLKGGTVVDGLGSQPYPADVAVKDGKIAAVGDLSAIDPGSVARVIDCTGRYISPGWVDIHSHSDGSVLEHATGLNLLVQGITCTVAGNCGGSAAPMAGRATQMLKAGEWRGRGTTGIMYQRYPDGVWGMADFMREVDDAGLGVNFIQLTGHNDLRRAVMGHDPREATPDEVKQMGALLEQSLDEGSFGLSTGLVFIPAAWSTTDEVVELASIAARYDGAYTSHVRGERETNIEACKEFIEIVERSGVRGTMSHMQSKWPVFGNCVMKMELLEAAMSRGADIAVDTETFPNWASTAARFLQIYRYTPEQLVELMSSPKGRAQLKHTMHTMHPWHPLGKFGPGGVAFRRAWDIITIYDCPHDRSLEGKTVAQVGAERGISYEDALFDLTVAEKGKGPLLIYDYIEDDHYRTAPWPHCIFPSIDTGLFDPAERLTELDLRCWRDTGYPGFIGLAPRVLGQFVRDEKLLTLQEAVRKMTSLCMQRMGVVDRGVVAPSMWADLTVFDPDTVALRSKDADPTKLETFYPTGIDYVVVNGEVAMEGHQFTGAKAGMCLRRA